MGVELAYVVTVNEYRHEIREKLKTEEGKWKLSLVKSFYTRAEADAYVADFRVKNSVGNVVKLSHGKVLMRDALEDYKRDVLTAKLQYTRTHPTMYSLNAWQSKPDYAWLFNKQVGDVTYEDIDDFIEQRENEDVSASTINRNLNILSPFFNYCIKQYKIRHWENPVARADRPKSDDKRDRILSDVEREKVYKACADSGSEMLLFAVQIAYETAIRRKELCNVLWSDVVLDGNNSHINLRKETTKTKEARTVPLSRAAQETVAAIQAWQATRKARESKLKQRREAENIYDFDYVLAGVSPRSIGQAFRRALATCDVQDFRFHDLRHCATTRLAETFEALELSSITGHSSPAMLKRYYNPQGHRLAAKLNKVVLE